MKYEHKTSFYTKISTSSNLKTRGVDAKLSTKLSSAHPYLAESNCTYYFFGIIFCPSVNLNSNPKGNQNT